MGVNLGSAPLEVRPRSVALTLLLLPFQVRIELLVLETDELHQFSVEHDALVHPDGPRLRVGLRIVDRDVDFESAEIRSPEAFGQLRGVGQRIAVDIEPPIDPRALSNGFMAGLPLSRASRIANFCARRLVTKWQNVPTRTGNGGDMSSQWA